MPAARLFGSGSPFLRKRINPRFDADEMLLQHLPNLLLHMEVGHAPNLLTSAAALYKIGCAERWE